MIDTAPSPAAGPHALTESADFVARVRLALLELSEPYRASMILREIRELSYREIGESLKLPTNTIKTHVHRGRRMLRELLGERLGKTEEVSTEESHVAPSLR